MIIKIDPDCEKSVNCSGKGECNIATGECACDQFFYSSEDCSLNGENVALICLTAVFGFLAAITSFISFGLCLLVFKKLARRLRVAFAVFNNKRLQRSILAQQLWMHELSTQTKNRGSLAKNEALIALAEKLGPTSWHVNPKYLKFNKKIGIGSYGDVYSGTLRSTTPVAIKLLKSTLIEANAIENFVNEITLWA